MSTTISKSFSKIKMNERKVEVEFIMHHYTDQEVKNTKIPMSTDAKPSKDFYNAMQAFRTHAINILELGVFKGKKIDEKVLERHIAHTVSISEGDDDISIIISLNRYLSSGKVVNINTPRISVYYEDYPYQKELQSDYETLISEADAFLNGKTGEDVQLSFNFSKENVPA